MAEVRQETAEFRREIDADNAAHGEPPNQPDWNLVMSDGDSAEDAVFVVTVFTQEQLVVYAGRGPAADVIGISNQFTLAEVEQFIAAMEQRFRIAGREVRVARGLAEHWLAA